MLLQLQGLPTGGWRGTALVSGSRHLPSPPASRAARQLAVWCNIKPQEESSAAPRYRGSDFVRQPLIIPYKRTAACRRCSGSSRVPCSQCGGTGRLALGGYQKRNPVSAARVIGSKWTAMERTFGWQHFRVLQKRGQGKGTFVLMAATCDEATQFWVNMQNLRERDRWASGWLQKQEIQALEQQRKQGTGGSGSAAAAGGTPAVPAAATGTACKACGATGTLPCPLCSLAGQVIEL